MRICEWCNGPINAEKRSTAKTCSTECSTLRHNRYAADRLRERYEKRAALPAKTCEQCGDAFVPYTKINRFCSRRCNWNSKTIAKRPRTRPCVKCGAETPTRPGRPVCTECRAERRDRSASDQRRRLKTYGLSQPQYDHLRLMQGDRCAICQTDEPGAGKSWSIDHCHATGVVRGLLCGVCNLAIGQMGDDPIRLREAADYIERSQKGAFA